MESEVLNTMHTRTVSNFLDLIILMELRNRSMSTYDIVSFVQNKFHILLSSDKVNSQMHSLENDGLVKAEEAQKKMIYTLTEQGKETALSFLNAKDKILGLVLNLFIGE